MNALARYLAENNLSTVQFAAMVGCHRTQIRRAVVGARLPGLDLAVRIALVTNGKVPEASWVEAYPEPAGHRKTAKGALNRRNASISRRFSRERRGSKS